MNISFSAIHMQVADPLTLQQFYGETLGLPVKTGPGGELAVQAGETDLVFTPAENGERPFYHFAFNIPENQLPAAQEWLAGKVELLPHPESGDPVTPWDAWNAHALYFYDPAGNIVELIARHDLPGGGTDPFGPQSLLYASEIGLPVADVPAAADFLKQRLDLPVYSQSGDSFCALGDPRGLLILVKARRAWWPTTDAHAGVFPLQVILGGGQEVLQIPDTPYQIGGLGGG